MIFVHPPARPASRAPSAPSAPSAFSAFSAPSAPSAFSAFSAPSAPSAFSAPSASSVGRVPTLLALLAVLGSGAACTKPSSPGIASGAIAVDPAASRPAQDEPAAPAPPVLAEQPRELSGADLVPPEDPEQLKALDAQIGQACVMDEGCMLYLRCVRGACAVPAAMSGVRDDATPRIRFYGQDPQAPQASFFLELATDDAQRARGLMFRRQMLDDWGMLFIYPQDGERSFWMKNTYMPLDMVFINSRGVVVGVVEHAEPMTLTPRRARDVARYVLELKAGLAAKHGIYRGLRVKLEQVRPEHEPMP